MISKHISNKEGVYSNTAIRRGRENTPNQEQLSNITQSSLDQAFAQLSRMLKPGNVVHRGIYTGDKSNLMVFTAVGGLGHPTGKCGELRKAGDC